MIIITMLRQTFGG